MDEENVEVLPTRTYRIFNGRITGYVDNLDAMRQAIAKALSIERFGWLIYSDNYGSEFQHLIGADYDLVLAEVERVITEALLADDRIVSITNFRTEKIASDSLSVSFLVTTIFGDIPIESEVGI